MGKYTDILKFQYKRTLEHRLNMILANLQAVVVLFILFYFWKGIYGNQERLGEYTFPQLITFYFLVRVMYNRISTFGAEATSKEIKSGEITRLVSKPVNYIKYKIITNSVGANLWTLGNTLSILAFSIFLYGFLEPPITLVSFILFISIFFINAILISSINLIIGFIGFWTTEISHLKFITTQIISLLSGALIPLTYYPSWAQSILNYLPFKFLAQFPIDVYLGKIQGKQALTGIMVLIIWTTVLYFTTQFVFKKGLEGYESFN